MRSPELNVRSNLLFSVLAIFFFSMPAPLQAAKFYTYVGAIGTDHVLLAWGTTLGANTIGRTSKSHGRAEVTVGDQKLTVSDKNWAMVTGLEPDKEYEYEVRLSGSSIGKAKIRTWPLKSEKLRFFVIGDFGTGDRNQYRVAAAMAKEFEKHNGENPVRFVLTTGDNLYGSLGFTLRFRDTGDEDSEWETKFYRPYEQVIARVPFYATLGNHDGNETEARGDLTAYLDNFFFPTPEPARYYRFSYGGHVDFFALDSTTNTEQGSPRPVYSPNSDQHKWLEKNLAASQVPWKVPYFHHPPYNGGPRHPAARNDLPHFIELFRKSGVRAVFTGHEHNFQYSQANDETGGVRYVVSGAGGELRAGDIRAEMARAFIEGWAPQLHFASVEIDGKEMRITPISDQPVNVVGADGKKIEMPLKIELK
jgi:hypothetical protein